MEYVLIDSNVFLDFFLKRESLDSSSTAIAKLLKSGTRCLISASEITDVYYILRKTFKDDSFARDAITFILDIALVADVQAVDIRTALSLNMKDFEDAVIAAVAKRYKASYILTNNIKDFANSPVVAKRPRTIG